MSANLQDKAAFEASFPGTVWRQVFHSVPKIPSDVNLEGKTVVVTGANVGLGLECARQLLQLRAPRLIMAVRSQAKGDRAAATLRGEFPSAKVEVWLLDMESYRSVQAFADRCGRELDRLDVAILNAGLGKMMFARAEESKREVSLQVNYISTALLAILLLPKLKASSQTSPRSGPGRLSLVSSDAGLNVKLGMPSDGRGIIDSVDTADGFDGFGQYSTTKLLVTMFVARLAQSVNPDEVIINCTNPSGIRGTELLREADSALIRLIFGITMRLLGREIPDGARIYLHSSLVLGKESHGSFTDWIIRPYPPLMYTEEGSRLSDKLWNETMEELNFAGPGSLLEGMKS